MKSYLMFLVAFFWLPTSAAFSQTAQEAGKPPDRQIRGKQMRLLE